ncbi:hypothetical protein BDW75DRAFT_251931 [Aspergillus navahoensis]
MALHIPRSLFKASARVCIKPITPVAKRFFSSEFLPQTYSPDSQYGSDHVSKLLKTSILSEFSEQEAKARIELAATYRLFGLKGWNENIYGHLTAKVHESDGSESFLINPFGLLYSEVTASSLIRVGADGSIKHPGVTKGLFGINDAGFVIHSAIHRARPNLQSVMHCHYPSAVGVSSLKQGFLELAQTSHQVGPIAYHDYQGVVVDRNEQKSLAEDMGDKNIMFLRNHGVITAGSSIGAAWYLMYQLLAATDIQSHASACALGDAQNLNMPSDRTANKTYEVMQKKGFSGAAYGLKELSAYMRLLDKLDSSYRT